MSMLVNIIFACLILSLVSLAGVVLLFVRQSIVNRYLHFVIAFATGTMLSTSFAHILPEGLERWQELYSTNSRFFEIILFTIIIYFIVEKFIHWHHCRSHTHSHISNKQNIGKLNLMSDLAHNFLDGLIIAAAFLTSPSIGVLTVIGVALHEIPQEIGDFGVLLYSGYSKQKTIVLNLLVGLSSILGGVVGYLTFTSIYLNLLVYAAPIAAGGMIYIAMSDLMPELHSEDNTKISILISLAFFVGVLAIYSLSFIEG